MKQIKRPFNFFVFYWTLGLIGGTLYVKAIQGWPLFCTLIGGVLIGTAYYGGQKQLRLFLISFLIGMMMLILHPTTRNVGQLEENSRITLKGTVQEIQSTDYGQNLVLKHITMGAAETSLYGKLQVSLSQDVYVGEKLQITGKVAAFPSPMNPSDFNYGQYLKGKNIVGVIKGQQGVRLGGHPNLVVCIRDYLSGALENIFKGNDEGIIQAALLGDDSQLVDETQALYSATGIGHILCVSGFHVALIVSFLLSFVAYIGLPYRGRYIFVISGIWFYALLTGMENSTVRASIMATVIMVARIIWEEEDFWISMALSILIILIWRPYSLFSMGFQLSFAAVGAIGISQCYLQKWGKEIKGLRKKLLQTVLPWLMITFITSPIIAFHYYEIPFLSSVLNLLVLPIFSLLIILGWLVLGAYLMGLNIIWPLVKGITILLQGIKFLCHIATVIPLGTICTGKPTVIMLMVYYGALVLMGLKLYGIKLSKKIYGFSTISLGIGLSIIGFGPKLLQITYLYVGQGDGTVITTPHQQVVVIDGGPFGKGKVMTRYIKYKGKREVAALMVSHSDSDHIGGIIEMIESNLKIQRVLISKADASENLDALIAACHQKNIPILELGATEGFKLDGVDFSILAPKAVQSDLNNNSLVCLATYKNFKALFTGDKEKESETSIYNGIGPISILKVSHHGSRTGTEEKLLLKLQPQYAMISCGINNRYNHPHEEVLTALATCEVPYKRTDLQGAIWVNSDGEKMALYTQIQSEREEE